MTHSLEFESWEQERTDRRTRLDAYLNQKAIVYRWFAGFPFGTEDGIPYLILRSLPLIAPELWGEGDDFLSVVGLFRDERQTKYPLARGMGWSGLGRDRDDVRPDFASFSCGACHVGRMRKPDGSLLPGV